MINFKNSKHISLENLLFLGHTGSWLAKMPELEVGFN